MRTIISMNMLAAAALALCAPLAIAADGVTDPLGDYVAGFSGSKLGDLDVLSSFVTYDPGSDKFVFSGTFAAAVGTSPGGFYVWGVNRGAGTAGFAANGVPGVLFDAVVIFNQDGSARITGTTPATLLPAGSVHISGATISGEIDGSFLPSTGFAKTAYTWNLWPRDGKLTGFAAISDFAPDNANLAVAAVPEPSTIALLAAGLGALAWRTRRSAPPAA
jgi:hypothetical protein